MKKTLVCVAALVTVLALILCSCGDKPKTAGEYTLTSELSDELKAEADAVLSEFIRCYEEDNAEGVLALLDEGLETTTEDIGTLFTELHSMAKNPFVPFDKYYLNGLTVGDTLIKVKHAAEDKQYLELVPASEELLCALYVSESDKISYMLSIMLTKTENGFKIGYFTPTVYKYNGMDAPAVYEKTKELSSAGKTVPAYIYSCMIGSAYRPGGYMRYENDVEMEDMCYKLYTEIAEKLPLPYALSDTANSSLYRISIVNDGEYGAMPLLLVRTDTPVSDKAAIEAECQKVIDRIEAISSGLRAEFSHAHMTVTNDTIDENNPNPKTETIIISLKQ
ncbi:MAG: hypothetical protein IJ299_04505 [Oscillospiraceae bacterium]|nr:hypothetical protein [Oscillospiraceae bacterium]